MKCWICGEIAETGEHEIKASDLKLTFGKIDQQSPMYWLSSDKHFNKVGSFKSDKLKFPNRLCKKCNNERTQPYDLAWEKLSRVLKSELKGKTLHGQIDLNREFPDEDKDSFVRHIQLYFLKIFGCFMSKGDVPIDLSGIAKNILEDTPCKSLYLIVLRIPENNPSVGLSEIRTSQNGGKTLVACFLYMVGEVVISVYYDPLRRDRRTIRKSLHPRNHGMKINYFVKKS